jgi:ABC-type dipeptide/oligopeptide/nickel transport system permease subunit
MEYRGSVPRFPGVTLLGLNFVGDGLRDALDPRAK